MCSIILVMSFCRLSPSRSTQRHKGRCGRRDGTKEKEGERGQNSLTCGRGGAGQTDEVSQTGVALTKGSKQEDATVSHRSRALGLDHTVLSAW